MGRPGGGEDLGDFVGVDFFVFNPYHKGTPFGRYAHGQRRTGNRGHNTYFIWIIGLCFRFMRLAMFF